ncbi:MAG: methyltransferase domain-containing protein [Chloroflexi bacterium]|nr:methyltransferase domain-containing protein [Chloroflexota bacterium]
MTAEQHHSHQATRQERHRHEQHGHGSHQDHQDHQDQHADHEHGGHHAHDGHRTHRFNPANIQRLLGQERQELLPVTATLQAAGIVPGHTVVDLGCGPGYFTLPAAALAGDTGRVYGVDVQPEMVDICLRRAAEAGHRQVDVLQSAEDHVPLAGSIADRVFIAFVLHETDNPPAFLREAKRLLKAGGEIAIVEWQKKDGPPGPPTAHRVSPEDVATVANQAGLRVLEQRPLNDHHYLVRLAAA